MKVLVTGASGFLGHAVCGELHDRGHEVFALVRRTGTEPHGAVPIAGDLLEPRFVFTSTVVTGEAGGATLDEGTALPVTTAYGRSKQQGEALVRESGLPWVIMRPSHVYGPGGWFAKEIVTRLRQPGRLVVIGSGENWWDVVRVEDVATACVDAAERAPAGALYPVVDDEPISQFDFVELTARALGVGPPRRVPVWLARRVTGDGPLRAVVRSARSANDHIKAELGWTPRFPNAREVSPTRSHSSRRPAARRAAVRPAARPAPRAARPRRSTAVDRDRARRAGRSRPGRRS